MNLAVTTSEKTTTQVVTAVNGELVVVAEFYAYGSTKDKRRKQTEHMAYIFIDGMKPGHRIRHSFKLKRLAVLKAVRQGALRWNQSKTNGHKLAALIVYACDALINPIRYILEEVKYVDF